MSALSPITYHGGALMTTPNVYLIWYGNWNQQNGSDTADGQKIVRGFLNGLGGSGYYLINTTYSTNNYSVDGQIGSISETTVAGSGRLSDRDITTIVSNAIASGKLGTADPNGVYFVITSSDIAKTGFCTQYCGWHTHGQIAGKDIKYSFVGNANRCLNSCAAQTVSQR